MEPGFRPSGRWASRRRRTPDPFVGGEVVVDRHLPFADHGDCADFVRIEPTDMDESGNRTSGKCNLRYATSGGSSPTFRWVHAAATSGYSSSRWEIIEISCGARSQITLQSF